MSTTNRSFTIQPLFSKTKEFPDWLEIVHFRLDVMAISISEATDALASLWKATHEKKKEEINFLVEFFHAKGSTCSQLDELRSDHTVSLRQEPNPSIGLP